MTVGVRVAEVVATIPWLDGDSKTHGEADWYVSSDGTHGERFTRNLHKGVLFASVTMNTKMGLGFEGKRVGRCLKDSEHRGTFFAALQNQKKLKKGCFMLQVRANEV